MLVLFETPGGYAIFKLLDEKKLSKTDDLYKDFETPEGANQILKLRHFEKFLDTTEALASTTAAIEGKIGKTLKKALKNVFKEAHEQILVADAKLGNAVKDKFDVPVVSSSPVQELMRCIRSQTESLLSGLPKKEFTAMALGLAHSLSRYKLKFSPDKVDVMIVQAIGLLDDLDKELNNYIMRCREWYGWHFPELGKIITDNLAFVRIVKLVGTRENVASTDLSDILTEEIEQQVKEAAEISMGTEISEDDIMNIQALCDQVIEMTQYRSQLAEYLKSRMFAVAPNLSVLLGEVIGARLIAHSGSLVNLAKQPASTLQIAGAEKALFRALKTQKNTPKYGLIYTCNIVAGASLKNRGKISRTLAAKASLASRVDALGDDVSGNTDLGLEIRAKIEQHLKSLEEGNLRRLSGTAKAKAKFEKYHGKSEILEYNAKADTNLGKRKKEKKPLIEDITPADDEVKVESEESPPKKMMLYIFHVDTGNMLSVDMNLALEDCIMLKEAIKKLTGIPVDKQVLLASGGESLEPNIRVCSYSAGTDTNPIYLFSKASIDAPSPPVASIDPLPNADLKEEVDASLNLPPTIQTVNMRCQLAQQICEQAKQISRVCDKLIHEQHLQQQGWAAVMANLEDVTAEFSNRSATFEAAYTQYLETRPQYLEMLDNFSNDIGLLSQIPILPVLAETMREMNNEEPSMEGSGSNKTVSTEEKKKVPRTLLEWISEKDSQYRVDQVAEICRKGLEQFDMIILEEIKTEVKTTLEISKKCHYREIKGLGDRLFGLDKLKTEAKKAYQEQVDLAQAFVHNQLRANNLGDASILPDLCASHKKQLVVMLQNHMQLRDLKRRIYKAKQELVTNLHHRLKWVMFTECRINELEMKLMMYRECLKRLRKQLTVLQQLHMAPSVYMTAVSEVVRRRAFSQAFLVWANDLACQLCAIYSEEVARRKNFHSQFEGHFLSALFPGLEDMPPSFATQPPEPFDDSLPKLTVEDIETLKTQLPKLELLLSVPDTVSITQFFLSRSSTNLRPEPLNPTASIEDRIVEAVTAAGLSSNLDPALLQPATECSQSLLQSANTTTTTQPISSDRHKNILYRGFESETDTEEFEKFVQSPVDACIEKLQDPIHHDKEELSYVQKEDAGEQSIELKNCLGKMGSTVGEAMAELKTNVGHLKQWILCERTELECLISQIQEAWSRQHDSLLKEIDEKKWALEKLNQSRDELTKELNNLREEMKAQESIRIQERKPDAVLKRTEEDKKSRHTTRSVSESHIGFIEAPRLELKDHDEIVARLKEQLAIERERAVQEERMRCEAMLSQQLAQAVIKADADKQALFNESFRRFFDKKFESMRSLSQDFDLNRSDLFADSSTFSDVTKTPSSVEEKINKIDIVRSMASSSSPKSRHKEASPSSSIVTIESNQSLVRDAATSPEPSPRKCRVSKEKLSESTNSLIQQGKISVGSCNEGDIVLVIWDENFGTYTILQETSSYTYFLHLDSLCSLGLRANPRKQYVIGEVINKEYCQAKKAENRYNVPVGSRFYRVRVRPLQVKGHTASQHAHSTS